MRVGFAGSMVVSRTTSEWRSQAIAQGNGCVYCSRRQHQHPPERMLTPIAVSQARQIKRFLHFFAILSRMVPVLMRRVAAAIGGH